MNGIPDMPPEISNSNNPRLPAMAANVEAGIADQNFRGLVPQNQDRVRPLARRFLPPPPYSPPAAVHGALPTGCPPPYDDSTASTRCLLSQDVYYPPLYDLPPPYEGLPRADRRQRVASQRCTRPNRGRSTARHTVIRVSGRESRRKASGLGVCCYFFCYFIFFILATSIIMSTLPS